MDQFNFYVQNLFAEVFEASSFSPPDSPFFIQGLVFSIGNGILIPYNVSLNTGFHVKTNTDCWRYNWNSFKLRTPLLSKCYLLYIDGVTTLLVQRYYSVRLGNVILLNGIKICGGFFAIIFKYS